MAIAQHKYKYKKFTPKPSLRCKTRRLIQLSGLLYAALMGWQRLSLAWGLGDVLQQAGMALSPWYLIVSGAVWLLFGLAAAGLMLVARRWAYRSVFGLSALIALTYWLDRLILTRSDIAQANWPFALFFSAVMLAISASLMVALSRQDPVYGKQ